VLKVLKPGGVWTYSILGVGKNMERDAQAFSSSGWELESGDGSEKEVGWERC
jgi:hypothetical protein